jgi:hypothetical protein
MGGKVVATTTVGHLSIDMTVPYEKDGLVMTTKITSELDLCPDVNGAVQGVAHVEASAVKNGVGQRLALDVHYQSTTDDDARTDSNGGIRMQAAQFGNGTKEFVDVSGGIGVGHLTDQKVNRTGGNVTQQTVDDTAALGVIGGLLAWVFMDNQVQQAAESGRCVELKPTVSAGPSGLQPGASVTITAAPRSRIDGSPVGGSVVATLTAGGASVAPQGSKQKADATFTYLAPAEKDKTGTVSLEARSKRGVAKASINFDTAAASAYQVVGGLQAWQVDQLVCDITKPFTLESPGVGVAEYSGGLSGTTSIHGIFDSIYSGTYEIVLSDGLGSPGTMTNTTSGTTLGNAGSGVERYVLTPAGQCT